MSSIRYTLVNAMGHAQPNNMEPILSTDMSIFLKSLFNNKPESQKPVLNGFTLHIVRPVGKLYDGIRGTALDIFSKKLKSGGVLKMSASPLFWRMYWKSFPSLDTIHPLWCHGLQTTAHPTLPTNDTTNSQAWILCHKQWRSCRTMGLWILKILPTPQPP